MARNPIRILGVLFIMLGIGTYGINRWLLGQVQEVDNFRKFGMALAVKEAKVHKVHYREDETRSDIQELQEADPIVIDDQNGQDVIVKKIIFELPLDELGLIK